MFLLPGGIPILLNIRSCTVVLDCIEQICVHLGITNKLEQHEFAIYYVVEAGNLDLTFRTNIYTRFLISM